jgi:hypothetical protein
MLHTHPRRIDACIVTCIVGTTILYSTVGTRQAVVKGIMELLLEKSSRIALYRSLIPLAKSAVGQIVGCNMLPLDREMWSRGLIPPDGVECSRPDREVRSASPFVLYYRQTE